MIDNDPSFTELEDFETEYGLISYEPNEIAPAIDRALKFDAIVSLVIDSLTSERSKRAYRKAIEGFLHWWNLQGRPPMSKAVVQQHKAHLQDRGLSPSTINQKLSAIRRLIAEAADNGLIDPILAQGITKVKGVRSGGRRTGNWLTRDQAVELLNAPDTDTLKGARDQAILAVLIGAGLRREEAASLTIDHLRQLEGRWAIVDLVGKRNRIRTVPLPTWARDSIERWIDKASISQGVLFRALTRSGMVTDRPITSQRIYYIVGEYADQCGFSIAPHDLRRTFAKLAHKGGAGLDQIQLSLGHASLTTTERYLGIEQSLTDAPADHLGITLPP